MVLPRFSSLWIWTKLLPQPSPESLQEEAPRPRVIKRQDTGIDRLPVELVLQILSYMPAIDHFAVKLAGSQYVTDVVRQHLSSIPFLDYIRENNSNIRDRWGDDGPVSALSLTAARGQVELYKKLKNDLDLGSNAVAHDSSHAALRQIVQRTRTCLVDRKVAFHWAAECGQDEMMKFILKEEHEASVAVSFEGKNPAGNAIHFAAANGHQSTVSLLLEAGMAMECGPKSALVWGAHNGHIDTVRLLKAWGQQVTDDTIVGAAMNGHDEMIEFLIDNWARPTHRALREAVRHGHFSTIQLLLRHKVPLHSPEDRQPGRKGLLDLALANGHIAVAQILVEVGAPVQFHPSTLSQAAGQGHLDCVKELLTLGAPRNGALATKTEELPNMVGVKDNSGVMKQGIFPPLHAAAGGNHPDIVELLLEHGCRMSEWTIGDWEPIHFAALAYPPGDETVVRLIHQHSGYVQPTTSDGYTPLHLAAQRGNYPVCKYLLNAGASVDYQSRAGPTPLQCAASNGHMDIVELFLDHGCNLHGEDYDGNTALHAAAMVQKAEICSLLLGRGTDPDTRNYEGRTAADLISRKYRWRKAPGELESADKKCVKHPPGVYFYPFKKIIRPDEFIYDD